MKKFIMLAIFINIILLNGCIIGKKANVYNNGQKDQLEEKINTETKDNDDTAFSLKETFINDKPILGESYSNLIKNLGVPKEIKYYKVAAPATEEKDYPTIAIAIYEDIQFEFYLSNEKLTDKDEILRFDITGDKYFFKNIKIGMPKAEFTEKLKEVKIENIQKETPSYKLLNDLKPKDYYKDYNQCAYIGGKVEENELKFYKRGTPTALGIVVLFKDDKVHRIVLGYPTAG